jgi:hypothetical protein
MNIGIILLLGGLTILASNPAVAQEKLLDRCSSAVAFPATYSGEPDSQGTVVINRGANGATEYTPVFRVQTKDNYIRWWCQSTTGNAADPGTWRIRSFNIEKAGMCGVGIVKVVGDTSQLAALAPCATMLKIGSSAKNGWTAERSRCDNRSTLISVRLDRDRKLRIRCMGR